jgi:arginyl-tRNA synthetase
MVRGLVSQRMSDPLLELRNAVEGAAERLRDGEPGRSPPNLERPPKPELGDYSTNAAMLLAPGRGEPPRDVAELLREELGGRLGPTAERIEVAGPGFLNLFLAERWYREGVAAVLDAGDRFGAGVAAEPQRIQVEFVSANPTGPLTAAGGRHAAYGDSVARVLALAGHEVQREYYVNDKGGQVRRFAESVAARMRGEEVPEDGYEGAYVEELASELVAEGVDAADLDRLELVGAERMREAARATLERFGVRFDEWFSERSLYESGKVEAALEELRGRGHVYDSEGAVWMRTTEFGDDKDRVLIRSDGEPTYFASDVAYHRDKLERGFDRLLNVLGADHHGHVARIKAALEALGDDPDRFEALIMQLVHVVEGGERAQMSKRRGEFVTLDELIDDIGTDAARFLMLLRSHDRTVDLDLDLARRQSQDNPVYYVQYAHARIASILRKAGEGAVEGAVADLAATLDAPVEPSERALVKRLLEMPGEVLSAAEGRAPHRLCAYATATAADFHAFYRDCKVIGAEADGAPPGTEAGRLALCVATKRVIARTLGLLGVGAPERM